MNGSGITYEDVIIENERREIRQQFEYEKEAIQNKMINEKDKEIERLNNIIKHTDSWIDRTIEIIKQQPSGNDEWILERLNSIKQCLKDSDK